MLCYVYIALGYDMLCYVMFILHYVRLCFRLSLTDCPYNFPISHKYLFPARVLYCIFACKLLNSFLSTAVSIPCDNSYFVNKTSYATCDRKNCAAYLPTTD